MHVATPIARMKESATLAVGARAAAMRAKGVDVIGFAMGEPDFDTPANVKRAAIAALEAGQTKYAPTAGTAAAREAIARKLREENGIECSASDVTITVGAKHAIYMALQALIEPGRGDEFLLPTPAWVSYRPLIELAGGVCVEVPGRLENSFRVTPEQIAAAVTPRTVGILLNSPSNPCGTVYSPLELRRLVDVLAPHPQLAFVSDEIYERLIYPEVEAGLVPWSPGSDPRIAARTVTINGMSKAFAMTGWRVGYLAAPGDGGRLAKEIIKLQGQMTNSIPTFFMPAIVEALSSATAGAVEEMRSAFARRARLTHQLLSEIPRLRTVPSTGAFYSFPDMSRCLGLASAAGRRIDGANAFAEALLDEAHVAVVPGEDFGAGSERHIRISFACAEAQLRAGLSRIAEFTASLR